MPRTRSERVGNQVKIIQPDGQVIIRQVLQRPHAATPFSRHAHRHGTQSRLALAKGIQFRDFERVLNQFGFKRVSDLDGHTAYREDKTGALVVLPRYKGSDVVRDLHLNTFRKLVVEKGLVEDLPTVRAD